MDSRVILTTKNIVVNSLNTQIVEVVLGQDQAMAINIEFFNTIILAGMPTHALPSKLVSLLSYWEISMRPWDFVMGPI
jgi:hypothetical protein